MSRPARTWLVFGLSAALAAAAMGWVTWLALGLEQAQVEAAARAGFEERVRAALWRMESALAPLVARESARAPTDYSPLVATERAITIKGAKPGRMEVQVPSPLLASPGPNVLLHFELRPDGTLSSPQAPVGRVRELAFDNGFVAAPQVEAAARRLADFADRVGQRELLAALPAAPAQLAMVKNQPVFNANDPQQVDNDAPRQPQGGRQGQEMMAPNQQAWNPKQLLEQQAAQQQDRNTSEYNSRAWMGQKQQKDFQSASPNNDWQPVARLPLETFDGLMRPLWFGADLVLARRVPVAGESRIQGCCLDWPALRGQLLADVGDLLPAARLEPVRGGQDLRQERMLAALPVRLSPGEPQAEPAAGLSPIRLALLAAWAGILLAAAAAATLLGGTLALAERRGAFVSAVTHELRSPLTTFRMYAEMLHEGMVPDEGRRRQYLATLRAEADRLGHLVENVLAYARLENSRHRGRVERLTLADLLERSAARLRERARQAGMELGLDCAAPAGAAAVRADPAAVEQILFNLVDNACKYAGRSEDRRIRLEAGLRGGRAGLRVLDGGPGVSPDVRGKMFRPFSRSAAEAAGSAPGVGLGLALSRRLARQMGGDLRLEDAPGSGACFVLELPAG